MSAMVTQEHLGKDFIKSFLEVQVDIIIFCSTVHLHIAREASACMDNQIESLFSVCIMLESEVYIVCLQIYVLSCDRHPSLVTDPYYI